MTVKAHNIHPCVERYLSMIETGEIVSCREQKALAAYVRRCFATEDIYTDDELLGNYLGMAKYFPYKKLFEWEEFCIALHLCTFWCDTGLPRWSDLFLLIGRGAGKDGYIAFVGMCLISPYNKCSRYDVDICAGDITQAERPMHDVIEVCEDADNINKLKPYFRWTKKQVLGIKNRGAIRGRTSNAKTKDGMRSGLVVFNEVHTYQNYENITVYRTGLGKTDHPRELFATTNGKVRGGPLDDMLADALLILEDNPEKRIPDNGMLPFICRVDDKEEANDPDLWAKANPSLPYLPSLRHEYNKEFAAWQKSPGMNPDFMTKRMNLPHVDAEIAVTDWDNIAATNRDIPYDALENAECIAGIDYAMLNDFASVTLHFIKGDTRYDISHSWLCTQSRELWRVKAPWQTWAEEGLITAVDDVSIQPEHICDWLNAAAKKYRIKKIVLDMYRFSLLRPGLRDLGYAPESDNLGFVRLNDIIKVCPVVTSAFENKQFVWGNNPVLRWAAGNTKLVPKLIHGEDIGNFTYAKIEAKGRKNDPFMALVAAMTAEDDLIKSGVVYVDYPLITW